MEKYDTMWRNQIAPLLNAFKKIKLHFTSLNYIPDYDLHHKLWISI